MWWHQTERSDRHCSLAFLCALYSAEAHLFFLGGAQRQCCCSGLYGWHAQTCMVAMQQLQKGVGVGGAVPCQIRIMPRVYGRKGVLTISNFLLFMWGVVDYLRASPQCAAAIECVQHTESRCFTQTEVRHRRLAHSAGAAAVFAVPAVTSPQAITQLS